MQRNLIIIGGGFLQVPLIETAHSMGLHTFVFDLSANAPGMKLAKHKVIMSTHDIDGCVREARKLSQTYPIHGVITAATDASRAVASIASALELPGIRYADAEACSNKVLMRKRLHAGGIPIPAFRSVYNIKEAREAMDELSLPLVLKPSENMGSRGVIKVTRRQEIYSAFRHAKKYSPTGEMIIEEYMIGDELSIDALAWESEIRITGIADRIISREEPFFIELGHNMPTAQSPQILEEASQIMRKAMQVLGICTGAAKGDLKITPQGIKIGEVAARLSGGFMSSHTYPLHSGVNLLQAAVRIALGENPQKQGLLLSPQKNTVAIERGILCSPGKILKITGVEAMSSISGIEHVYIMRQEGEVMPPITSNIDKLGHIIAQAPTLAAAESAAKKAQSCLELEIDESYGIDWEEVKEKARQRFGDQICWVCKICDGQHCASGVPGMGGVGSMESFQDNSRALSEIRILPRYIRNTVEADLSIELFGRKLDSPIMAAPMTGAVTNMNGALDEYEFARILLQSCRTNNTLGWVGDGASPEKYLTIMKALKEEDGFGVAIFKPRSDKEALQKRFQLAQELGIVGVGIDIDAVSFPTMKLRKEPAKARNIDELKRIRDMSTLPFVLKGIMCVEDAKAALSLGADAIVVSNHGGRVLDQMPGTARVLPAIAKAIAGKIPVLADGGVRSGQDVFKMLALGADAVLVGRPLAIAAVGGGMSAVKYLLSSYAADLKNTMHLCGTAALEDISSDYLHETPAVKPSAFTKP